MGPALEHPDRPAPASRPAPAGAAPGAQAGAAATAPRFRALGIDECLDLLDRQQVGRLAYLLHGQVGIVPLHYVFADGWLYGRTQPGTKVTALRHHPWVAFEVDEVAGPFDWRSVVVHGAFYLIERNGPQAERARWARAVELMRTLVPDTFTDADPTPGRDVLFRIHVGELTGREARSR